MQETWIAVLRGIDRFEGRSSLRTWVFRILINQAKTRGAAERRTVPFSCAFPTTRRTRETRVPLDGLRPMTSGMAAALGSPAGALGARRPRRQRCSRRRHGCGCARRSRRFLPASARWSACATSQGFTGADVARELDVTEGNQRVLLHRGRDTLRAAIGDVPHRQLSPRLTPPATKTACRDDKHREAPAAFHASRKAFRTSPVPVAEA